VGVPAKRTHPNLESLQDAEKGRNARRHANNLNAGGKYSDKGVRAQRPAKVTLGASKSEAAERGHLDALDIRGRIITTRPPSCILVAWFVVHISEEGARGELGKAHTPMQATYVTSLAQSYR
jgi:hypothetical protein